MSKIGQRIIERLEERLTPEVLDKLAERVPGFAEILAPRVARWSRRPWMRPPTQTGRRK